MVASDGVAELTVEDDGTGFDPEAIEAGHLGIEGMRARASGPADGSRSMPRRGGGRSSGPACRSR